jgi:hypothetical protein
LPIDEYVIHSCPTAARPIINPFTTQQHPGYNPFSSQNMPTNDPELEEISTVSPPAPTSLQSKSDDKPKDGPFLADESPLRASEQTHAAALKKGRPRKDDLPQKSVTRDTPIPIPHAPCAVFRSDATNASQRSRVFYNWWNALPGWVKDRTLMYVYRTWPVLVTRKEEIDGKKEFGYIDKISGNEPIQDDTDLLRKYGCGSYTLLFNENPGRTICTIYIDNVGGGRMLDHPPTDRRVDNPEENLDMGHPANKSYIEYLRGRGKLPEQQIKEKAEAEMATVQAMERMADTNKELMHEVINMAKDKSAPANDSVSVMASAATKGQEILQSAVTQAMGMIAAKEQAKDETLDTALKIVDRITNANKGPDPSAMVNPYLEEIRELRRDLEAERKERLASLERRLEEKTAAASVPPVSQFASIKEGITAFKEMKTLVDDVSGKGGGGDDGEDGGAGGPAWLRTAASFAPHVSSIFGTVRDIFGMYMMAQRGMGAVPQQMPQPQSGTPMPMHQTQTQPQPQAHVGPQLVPAPQPQPQPVSQMPPQNANGAPAPPIDATYGLHPQLAQLLSSITIPFLNGLETSVRNPEGDPEDELFKRFGHGGLFADWFVGGFGEVYYKNVCGFGDEMMVQALYAYPPIAENIPKAGADQMQVRKFVKEFMAYKVEDVEEGEEGEGGDGPPDSTPDINGGAA